MAELAGLEGLQKDYFLGRGMGGNEIAVAGEIPFQRAHDCDETVQGFGLNAGQRQALMALVGGDDPGEKREVIAHNLRLVVEIARRYADGGVEFMDMVSAGTTGLIHALEKFELEGGFRFSAYAKLCIRDSIEDALTHRNSRLSLGTH